MYRKVLPPFPGPITLIDVNTALFASNFPVCFKEKKEQRQPEPSGPLPVSSWPLPAQSSPSSQAGGWWHLFSFLVCGH